MVTKISHLKWLSKPGNKELANAMSHKWRLEHIEQVRAIDRERSKKYRDDPENKEHKKEYLLSWQRKNPDKIRAAKLRRRQNIGDSKITHAEIKSRIDLLGHSCIYCGNDYEHLDHLVPIHRGGKHIAENLVPSCERCNESKQDKDWITWFRAQPFFNEERFKSIRLLAPATAAPSC